MSKNVALEEIKDKAKYSVNKNVTEDDPNKELYKNAINHIIYSLYTNYSTKDTEESNGFLFHAVYAKSFNNGIDECNVWG